MKKKRLSFPGIKMNVCYLQVKVKGNWQSCLEQKVWPRLVLEAVLEALQG